MEDFFATAMDRVITVREQAVAYMERYNAMPPNERNQILVPALVAGFALLFCFYACCTYCCRCLRRCMRRGCCPTLPCCASDTGPYVRLAGGTKDVSAQCNLLLRCSLKFCWLSLPIPYISFSCTAPEKESSAQAGHTVHSSSSSSWFGGGEDEDEDGDASPDKEAPAVTELVALQVKGAWEGPLNVWLSGVDALHPTGLRQRGGSSLEPMSRWTKLYGVVEAAGDKGGDSGGGGQDGRVSIVAFREPVKLRAGFECQLAVQLEPRRTAPAKPQYLGAGATTLAVYDEQPDSYQVLSSPAGANATAVTNAPPPSASAAAPGVPSLDRPLPYGVRPTHVYGQSPLGSPRVAVASPRVTYGHDPRREGDACTPSANSSRTAWHRQRHGGLSNPDQ